MLVMKENEKRYLRNLDYNIARVFTKLAQKVTENGGIVEPLIPVTIINRDDKSEDKETFLATHTSYIRFVMNDLMYYYQTCDNPFFPFYYIKTPIIDGRYSADACLDETPKAWLYDYLWNGKCSEEEIEESTKTLFDMLVKSSMSVKRIERRSIDVPNTYSSGFHKENVYDKERFKAVWY